MMKKKNGFTLVEMLGVISLIAMLMFLIVPSTASILKKNKEKAFDIQIKNIEEAAVNWATKNIMDLNIPFKFITLNQLKEEKLIEEDTLDPRTDECISNDILIGITTDQKEVSAKVNLDTYKTSDTCYVNEDEKELLSNKLNDNYESNTIGLNNSYEFIEINRQFFYSSMEWDLVSYKEDRNIYNKSKFFDFNNWVKIKNKLYQITSYDEQAIYIRYVKNCSSGTCVTDKTLENNSYYGFGFSSSSIITSWDDSNNRVEKDIDQWYGLQGLDDYTIPLNLVNSYDIDKDGLTSRSLLTTKKKRYNFLTIHDFLHVSGASFSGIGESLFEELSTEITDESLPFASSITYNKDGKVAVEQVKLTNLGISLEPNLTYCTSSSCSPNKFIPIFNLRPDIKFVSGTGTEIDPFIVEP